MKTGSRSAYASGLALQSAGGGVGNIPPVRSMERLPLRHSMGETGYSIRGRGDRATVRLPANYSLGISLGPLITTSEAGAGIPFYARTGNISQHGKD